MSNGYDDNSLHGISELQQTVESERKVKLAARQKLVSCQLNSNVKADLPGGFWKNTSTVEFQPPVDKVTEEDNQGTLTEAVDMLSLSSDMRENRIPTDKTASDRHKCIIFGQDVEELKRQETKQRALLRRLYMDIEREQVKEYKKMKSHMDKIAQIKKVKEDERKRLELEAEVETRNTLSNDYLSNTKQQVAMRERQQKREQETRRYILALKTLLKEKLDRLGVDIPPLCSCGETVWDTHPDTCANNCPFYKNPKGYERAMQTLLTSCDQA